jgi:hypothetical protein
MTVQRETLYRVINKVKDAIRLCSALCSELKAALSFESPLEA